jgi:hypothetical protein
VEIKERHNKLNFQILTTAIMDTVIVEMVEMKNGGTEEEKKNNKVILA